MSAEEAADRLGLGLTTLYRTEKNGTNKTYLVLAMSKAYKMDQTLTEYLVELARRAGKRGWWAPYSGSTATTFQDYLSLEEDAVGIRTYEPELIPALLQTEAYAAEVTRRMWTSNSPAGSVIDQRVDLRMQRQTAAFQRGTALHVDAVIHESALRRVVGNPELMTDQVNHLIEVAQWNNIELRILPSGSGAHAGMQGAFVILDFPETIDPPVIYVEYLTGSLYLEEAIEIDAYRLAYDKLREQALDPDQSLKLARDVASDLAALRT